MGEYRRVSGVPPMMAISAVAQLDEVADGLEGADLVVVVDGAVGRVTRLHHDHRHLHAGNEELLLQEDGGARHDQRAELLLRHDPVDDLPAAGRGLRIIEDEVVVLQLAVEAFEDLQKEIPYEEGREDADLPGDSSSAGPMRRGRGSSAPSSSRRSLFRASTARRRLAVDDTGHGGRGHPRKARDVVDGHPLFAPSLTTHAKIFTLTNTGPCCSCPS